MHFPISQLRDQFQLLLFLLYKLNALRRSIALSSHSQVFSLSFSDLYIQPIFFSSSSFAFFSQSIFSDPIHNSHSNAFISPASNSQAKMMKVVLKVEISDSKTKKKVLRAVSTLLGIVSMVADTKENKITVIGTADPVKIVGKVRKVWPSSYIISVAAEKVEEKKKEEPKKEESTPKIEQIDWAKALTTFPSYPTTHYYYPRHEEYNPNACVIS